MLHRSTEVEKLSRIMCRLIKGNFDERKAVNEARQNERDDKAKQAPATAKKAREATRQRGEGLNNSHCDRYESADNQDMYVYFFLQWEVVVFAYAGE